MPGVSSKMVEEYEIKDREGKVVSAGIVMVKGRGINGKTKQSFNVGPGEKVKEQFPAFCKKAAKITEQVL